MTYRRGIDGGPWDETDPGVPNEDLDSEEYPDGRIGS